MEASTSINWSDFDTLRHSIKSYTVDKLKSIITGLNEEISCSIAKTGKKQELIDRISYALDSFRPNHPDKWARARMVLYQVKQNGAYTPSKSSYTSSSYSMNPRYGPSTPIKTSTPSSHRLNANSVMTYPPTTRLPIQPSASSSQSMTGTPLKFKPSPFFKIDETVSDVLTCPESSSQTDRRSCNLKFHLTPSQINKLQQPNSKYQLRLFCTSSTFYVPGAIRGNSLCPIEFPATCEVRINGVQISANLKGVKKKPGTAPPADLSSSVRKVPGVHNALEMIYINSQPNSAPKKFYLVIYLVETTDVVELVERLRQGKRKSYEEVKGKMVKETEDDDEIVMGKQSISLKCPLSFTRIQTPTRSEKCVHPQCFDATSWYSVMEQTTTWLCPICERTLEPNDLFLDGYLECILSSTHEDVDEVTVEPDGEWHTSDDKYASAGWVTQLRAKDWSNEVDVKPTIHPDTMANTNRTTNLSPVSATQRNNEIFVLDSDSDREVEGQVQPSPGYSRTNGSIAKTGVGIHEGMPRHVSSTSQASVIDLTLDSDTEDSPRSVERVGKRKADDALADRSTDTIKRPREGPLPLPLRRDSSISRFPVSGNSGSHVSPFESRTLPPLTSRQPSSGLSVVYQGLSLSHGNGDRSPMGGFPHQSQRPYTSASNGSLSGASPNGYRFDSFGGMNGVNGGSSSPDGWR